jgi:alpha-N-acetyl-neuraminate alpha-2,8-sialyltransferase (sialyltransferase 8B)
MAGLLHRSNRPLTAKSRQRTKNIKWLVFLVAFLFLFAQRSYSAITVSNRLQALKSVNDENTMTMMRGNPMELEDGSEEEEENDSRNNDNEEEETIVVTNSGQRRQQEEVIKGDAIVSRLLRERDLDKFGRKAHAYAHASDRDYSAIIIAKDNASTDKYDVKYTDVNGKKTHFQLGDVLGETLPEEESAATKTHRACALVGNSGTLLKSQFGEEIDGHDAVMRVNFAPVKNFKRDVGVKTTYDFSNRENARRLVEKGWENSRPDSVALFFEGSSPTNRKRIFEPLVKKYGKSLKVQFLHPGFVNRAHDLWNVLKEIIEKEKKKQFHDKPMSGWYAVNFMMQRCESLDLYGFEPYTSKAKATAPYHYFDQVQGVVSVHSFDFAVFAYQKFAKVFPLRIRTKNGWIGAEED